MKFQSKPHAIVEIEKYIAGGDVLARTPFSAAPKHAYFATKR